MRKSNALPNKSKLVDQISRFFDKKFVNKTARTTRFVQRASTFTGMDLLLLSVFSHQQNHTISLQGYLGELLFRGKVMTKQSLQERFNKYSVDFMEKMLTHALSQKLAIQKTFQTTCFKRIIIGDATSYQLSPDYVDKYKGNGGHASISSIKIQYNYDLLTNTIILLSPKSGHHADIKSELGEIKKDDLRIDDLGYFHINRFLCIQKTGAYFLSRHRYDVHLYKLQNEKFELIDLVKLKRGMREGEQRSIICYVGKNELMKIRVVIEKVPQRIVAEKRRKLKLISEGKLKFISKKRLELCAINTYLTNASTVQLPTKEVRKYYSLRWQIELLFKAWKSTYSIDKIKGMKIERFECITYGTLLLIVITSLLLAHYKSTLFVKTNREISEMKFFKIIKQNISRLKNALQESTTKLVSLIKALEKIIILTCSKEIKKHIPPPFKILKIIP